MTFVGVILPFELIDNIVNYSLDTMNRARYT